MYLFLDDSGVINGNGPLYLWAGIAIDAGYKTLESQLDQIFNSFPVPPKGHTEWKGNRANFDQRKAVFDCLAQWTKLRICYVVTDKAILTEGQKVYIKSPSYNARNKEQAENYFISKVVARLAEPSLSKEDDKKVILYIDGKPSREHESEIRLHEYLSLRFNFPKWNKKSYWNNFIVKYNSSPNNRMLQAVDFLASFLNDYYRYMYKTVNKNKTILNEYVELYEILRPKIHHKILGFDGISLI